MAFRRGDKRGCAAHPSATVRPLQEEDSLIQFMGLEDALIANDDFVKQIADGQQTEQPAIVDYRKVVAPSSPLSILSCSLVSMGAVWFRLGFSRSPRLGTNFCRFKAISSRSGLRRRAVAAARNQRPMCRLIL